jgi:hypothetical protein
VKIYCSIASCTYSFDRNSGLYICTHVCDLVSLYMLAGARFRTTECLLKWDKMANSFWLSVRCDAAIESYLASR